MWGVTLNPGSHHRQQNRAVTRNWSAAPRLINAETKSSLTLVACLLGYFISERREEVNSWLVGRTKRLHCNRLEMVVCGEPSILGSFGRCCHLSCSGRFPGRQGHIRLRQWADDCDVPYERLPTLPRNQSEAIWAFAVGPTQTLRFLCVRDWRRRKSTSYQLVKGDDAEWFCQGLAYIWNCGENGHPPESHSGSDVGCRAVIRLMQHLAK